MRYKALSLGANPQEVMIALKETVGIYKTYQPYRIWILSKEKKIADRQNVVIMHFGAVLKLLHKILEENIYPGYSKLFWA